MKRRGGGVGRGLGKKGFSGTGNRKERIMGRETLVKEYYVCIKL